MILSAYYHTRNLKEAIGIMVAQQLSKQGFANWGDYISANDRNNVLVEEDFHYVGNIAVFPLEGDVSASVLIPCKREIVLWKMERHKDTAEVCVALKNDSVFFVAQDCDGHPDIDNIQAFYLRQGDTIVFKAGIWHWVPFPVEADQCKLLIYKNNTGDDDFYLEELTEPIKIAGINIQ